MHVLRQTWSQFKDAWNETGLPTTERLAAKWHRHLTDAAGAGPLFADNLFSLSPVFSQAIERAAGQGMLRVIPLWGLRGGFYLPDGEEVYIGFAPEAVQFVGHVEERAECLSEQFATLANKTRME